MNGEQYGFSSLQAALIAAEEANEFHKGAVTSIVEVDFATGDMKKVYPINRRADGFWLVRVPQTFLGLSGMENAGSYVLYSENDTWTWSPGGFQISETNQTKIVPIKRLLTPEEISAALKQ